MLEWYIDNISNLIIREILMLQNNKNVDNNTKEAIKLLDIIEWKNKTENMKNHIKEENAMKIINAWMTYIKLIHDKKDWSELVAVLLEAPLNIESFIMCMSL